MGNPKKKVPVFYIMSRGTPKFKEAPARKETLCEKPKIRHWGRETNY